MQSTLATGLTLLARDPDQIGADGKGLLRRVAHLRQKSLSDRLGSLSAANPDEYGPAYSIPGESSWSIRASGLRAYGGDRLQLGAGLRALRRAKEERRHAGVVLAYPNGSTREGRCIVEGLPVEGGGMRKPLEGSLQLSGVGALSREEGLRFWGRGAGYDPASGTWTDESTYARDATQPASEERPGLDTSGAFPALTFDGASSRLALAEGALRGGDYGFTFAGVARVDSEGNRTIIGGGEGAAEIDLDTQDGAGRLGLRIGEAPPLVSPSESYEVGAWFAFLAAYTPGRGRRLLVSSGSLAASSAQDDTGEVGFSGGGDYYVGAEGGANYLDGAIADLRVFGGALAPAFQHYTLTRLTRAYLR